MIDIHYSMRLSMKTRTIFLICTVLILSACSSAGDDSVAEATSTSLADAGEEIEGATDGSGPSASSHLCDNNYYPVSEGVEHSYLGDGGPSGDFAFTTIVEDVREDGFTLVTLFDELTLTQQWACLAEGLVPLEYIAGPSAQISTEGGQATFETSEVSGLYLPASIEIGDTWSQSFSISGTQEVPGTGTSHSNGEALYEFEAIAFEIVSTSAGDFESLAISVTLSVDLTVQIDDLSFPSSFTTNGISYFVAGNGWVKSVDSAEIFGIVSDYITDLTGFHIP
jgi:hypothetical protein